MLKSSIIQNQTFITLVCIKLRDNAMFSTNSDYFCFRFYDYESLILNLHAFKDYHRYKLV